MLYLIILGLLIFTIYLVSVVLKNRNQTKKVFKDNVYTYLPKVSVMTSAETDFFRRLERISEGRYYVFPQVHLSALLDHRVNGQEWRYAFRHINGKSVDFVLCDIETLRPTYAVELDDYTHDFDDRKKRDVEVERIFAEAGLPLVRFKNYRNMSDAELISAFAQSKKLSDS